MSSIKTPTQFKAEHPDWTDKQAFNAFEKSLQENIQGIREDLQSIKGALDNDTALQNDGWARWYSEFLRRADSLLNPDFGDPTDFDSDSSATPEQEEVMEQIISARLK